MWVLFGYLYLYTKSMFSIFLLISSSFFIGGHLSGQSMNCCPNLFIKIYQWALLTILFLSVHKSNVVTLNLHFIIATTLSPHLWMTIQLLTKDLTRTSIRYYKLVCLNTGFASLFSPTCSSSIAIICFSLLAIPFYQILTYVGVYWMRNLVSIFAVHTGIFLWHVL